MICERTATVEYGSALPMTFSSSGTAFSATSAVVTGAAALWPPPRPGAGVDWTASLPEQAAAAREAARATGANRDDNRMDIIQIAMRR